MQVYDWGEAAKIAKKILEDMDKSLEKDAISNYKSEHIKHTPKDTSQSVGREGDLDIIEDNSIIFSCPGCKKKYKVLKNLAGKKARCKQCNSVINIPAG